MANLSPLIARQQLISVYLRGNTKLNDESVKALLVSKCQTMTTLDLSKCHKITNQSLARIADSLSNLENVLLYACAGLSDVGTFVLKRKLSDACHH
jgi:phage gp36-like protein